MKIRRALVSLFFAMGSFAVAQPADNTIRASVRITATASPVTVNGRIEAPLTRKTGRKIKRERVIDTTRVPYSGEAGHIEAIGREIGIPNELRARGFNRAARKQDDRGYYIEYTRVVEETVDEVVTYGRGACDVQATIGASPIVSVRARQVLPHATGTYQVGRCEPEAARAAVDAAARDELVRVLREIDRTPVTLSADELRALASGRGRAITRSIPFTFAGASGTLQITITGQLQIDGELGI